MRLQYAFLTISHPRLAATAALSSHLSFAFCATECGRGVWAETKNHNINKKRRDETKTKIASSDKRMSGNEKHRSKREVARSTLHLRRDLSLPKPSTSRSETHSFLPANDFVVRQLVPPSHQFPQRRIRLLLLLPVPHHHFQLLFLSPCVNVSHLLRSPRSRLSALPLSSLSLCVSSRFFFFLVSSPAF